MNARTSKAFGPVDWMSCCFSDVTTLGHFWTFALWLASL